MGHFSNVLLAIYTTHTVQQGALDSRPGLGGLNQGYGPNRPNPSVWSSCDMYINIFTRCTKRNQYDILMTVIADVS